MKNLKQMPTGSIAIKELKKNQQQEFKAEFIKQKGVDFFNRVMQSKVYSVGSLLRAIDWSISSKGSDYWKQIFFYHITPKFARK